MVASCRPSVPDAPADGGGSLGDHGPQDSGAERIVVEPAPDASGSDASTPDVPAADTAVSDAPAQGDSGADADGAPGQPLPSLHRCQEYQHSQERCDPSTGAGDWVITGLAYSPDGRMLASAGNNEAVALWTASGTALARDSKSLPTKGKPLPAFAPAGNSLAIGSTKGHLAIHHLAGGREPLALKGHSERIVQLAFLAGGSKLVSLDASGKVLVWAVADGAVLGELPQVIADSSGTMAVDPRGTTDSQWVAFGRTTGHVELVDVLAASWSPSIVQLGASAVVGAAFAADGNTLAVGTQDGEVALLDTSDKSALKRAQRPIVTVAEAASNRRLFSPWELAFSRDGNHLFVASGGDDPDEGGAVRVYSVPAASVVGELTSRMTPYRMALAPDDSSLAVGYDVCGRIMYCSAE